MHGSRPHILHASRCNAFHEIYHDPRYCRLRRGSSSPARGVRRPPRGSRPRALARGVEIQLTAELRGGALEGRVRSLIWRAQATRASSAPRRGQGRCSHRLVARRSSDAVGLVPRGRCSVARQPWRMHTAGMAVKELKEGEISEVGPNCASGPKIVTGNI